MTSSPPTSNSSTSRYRPPQLRGNTPSSSRSYLTYEDLHARFSPPHSPPLRMPRVQRSLSADDLLQRYRGQKQGQQQGVPGQSPPVIPVPSPVPSPPPAVPPDLEAFRPIQSHRPLSPHSANRSTKQSLSTKLPDPPVFNGINTHIEFDDWKLRIQDKLTHNSDHYPCESFKVAYVMTRLGGEASKHITLKRRKAKESLSNGDLSSKELLDQLSDLYETPLSVIYKENRHALNHLKQGIKQSFFDFYTKWVRYSERGYAAVDEEIQAWDLEDRLKKQLRTPLANQFADYRNQPWTIPKLKVYLMRLDQSQRIAAERLAHEKAQAFAAQYARAKAEAEINRSRSGIKILSRSDSGYESGEDPAYWR